MFAPLSCVLLATINSSLLIHYIMPLPLPHTLLLQSLLLEPYLTTEALNKLHGAVCTTYRETIPLPSMITQINAQLYKVGMALKVANGNAALVMTVDDEVAKITERPVNETMLFKKIVRLKIIRRVRKSKREGCT